MMVMLSVLSMGGSPCGGGSLLLEYFLGNDTRRHRARPAGMEGHGAFCAQLGPAKAANVANTLVASQPAIDFFIVLLLFIDGFRTARR